MSSEYVIEAENIEKYYTLGSTRIMALLDISLRVRRGEYLSIMGPSGSGKTTLFNVIGAIDKPTSGRIFIDDVDITELDAFELAWLRCRKIGYIFQTFNLIPVLTALENVALPAVFAGCSQSEAAEKAKEMLEQVGLKDRLNHKPSGLSGGQQQRVAIARALINDPDIILADEPTGNLDLRTGLAIINLLKTVNQQKGVTVITATHDLKMMGISDRILYLRDGRLEREETVADIELKGTRRPEGDRMVGGW
jgi:putative ABC transport system ATP-binding protein